MHLFLFYINIGCYFTDCMQWNETDDLVEILDQLKSSLRVLNSHKFDNHTFEQVFCEGHSLSKAIVKVRIYFTD